MASDAIKLLAPLSSHSNPHSAILCCAVLYSSANLRADPCAGQLPVVGDEPVSSHGSLHRGQGIRGHLVPQPSRAAVDHHTHLQHGAAQRSEMKCNEEVSTQSMASQHELSSAGINR